MSDNTLNLIYIHKVIKSLQSITNVFIIVLGDDTPLQSLRDVVGNQ